MQFLIDNWIYIIIAVAIGALIIIPLYYLVLSMENESKNVLVDLKRDKIEIKKKQEEEYRQKRAEGLREQYNKIVEELKTQVKTSREIERERTDFREELTTYVDKIEPMNANSVQRILRSEEYFNRLFTYYRHFTVNEKMPTQLAIERALVAIEDWNT